MEQLQGPVNEAVELSDTAVDEGRELLEALNYMCGQ